MRIPQFIETMGWADDELDLETAINFFVESREDESYE